MRWQSRVSDLFERLVKFDRSSDAGVYKVSTLHRKAPAYFGVIQLFRAASRGMGESVLSLVRQSRLVGQNRLLKQSRLARDRFGFVALVKCEK
jgi:hypothetical protein